MATVKCKIDKLAEEKKLVPSQKSNSNEIPWKALLDWYSRNRREMPWRTDPQPYRVWISEIMLQQTRVEAVIPYFERFLARFPDVSSLAEADLSEVLKLWEGLGYYSRARSLHFCARQLVASGGVIPSSEDELAKFPGFGPYTSAAVASIAFGAPTPTVDGNVLRVMTRLLAWDRDPKDRKLRDEVYDFLCDPIRRSGDPSSFNQAMMELGATVCTPRKPSCIICPLSTACSALSLGLTEELPRRAPTKAIPEKEVVIAVIRKGKRILVQQRSETGLLPGLWEFPGGEKQSGETDETALIRKIREQNGISLGKCNSLRQLSHAYSHFRINVTVYEAACSSGNGMAGEGLQQVAWLPAKDIESLPRGLVARRITDILLTTPGGICRG